MTQNIVAMPLETVVRTTGNQTITGLKTFSDPILIKEVQDPFVTNITPVGVSTTSGNILSFELVEGCLIYTGAGDGVHSLPTGTDVDAVLLTPNNNRGLRIRVENQTDFVWVLLPNTGMTFTGLAFTDALVVQARGTLILDLIRNGTANYLLAGGYQGYSVINVTGTSKTLGFPDLNSLQRCNNAATQTITVPLNSAVPFPISTRIDVAQIGAGQVVLAAAGGVTINSKLSNLKLSAQFSGASLTKTAINTWLLVGDLSA